MRPLCTVLVIAHALGLLATGAAPPAAAQGQSTPVRIMPLGDSITVGVPGTGGYRAPLFDLIQENLFDVDFVGSAIPSSSPAFLDDWHHEGHSGWTVENLTEFAGGPTAPPSSIEGWLEIFDPAIILLHAGTNDLGLDQQDPLVAGQRLQLLLKRIYLHSPKVHVVLARIVPLAPAFYDWKWASYNQAVDWLVENISAAGYSITSADMFTAFATHPEWESLYLDPIHPNQAGYDVMAQVWFEALEQLVADLGGPPGNPPLAPPPILQTVVESPLDGAFPAATDDLIQDGSPSLAGVVHAGYDGGEAYPVTALNDGYAGPGADLATDPVDEQWSSTFLLDLEASPAGYDIHGMRGIDYAGGPAGAGGFGAQAFSVYVEFVHSPGVFVPVGGFRYAYSTGYLAPPTGGSGLVRLNAQTAVMASGVSAIRVRFVPDPGQNAVTAYTELDVLGAPTAAGH